MIPTAFLLLFGLVAFLTAFMRKTAIFARTTRFRLVIYEESDK